MLNSTVRGKKAGWGALGLCLGMLNAPAFNAEAATLSTVFAFDQHLTAAGVVEGDGNNLGVLFGTTYDTSVSYGGAIFKVPLGGGAPQIVYQLQSTDGYSPQATLLLSTDHYLYGTTHYGPRAGSSTASGAGTIFRVAQDGSGFATLHTFEGSSEGGYPDRALIEDATYLYGVATAGGTNNTGTVFRVRKSDGLFQVLHQFAGLDSTTGASVAGEGAYPSSSLTLVNGRLYGVTSGGGTNLKKITDSAGTAVTVGTGTLYSLNIDGSGFQTHHHFSALDDTAVSPSDSSVILSYNADGVQPNGNLLEVSPGVLVGTTSDGGDPHAGTVSGYGTVFRFDTATASLNTLYAFDNDTGALPKGTLVKDRIGGMVYGMTTSGSTASTPVRAYGSLFRINPTTAEFAVEYSLAFAEGSQPTGELIQAANGDLFTTAAYGSACTGVSSSGYGAVLRYSLATNGSSSGYANCTVATSSGGGGVMSPLWLWLLATLGCVPVVRRRLFSFS